jgi:hypothetical protein
MQCIGSVVLLLVIAERLVHGIETLS